MDFSSRRYERSRSSEPAESLNQDARNNTPIWPPSRGAYQNLSSTDDLHLEQTPPSSRPFLAPEHTPSQYIPYTPGQESSFDSPAFQKSSTVDTYTFTKKNKTSFLGEGWRAGTRLAFFSAILVLVVNICLMVSMTLGHEWMDGFPIVYRGNCDQVQTRNTIIHLAINVLSTIVLCGSNYCMQLLSSPNRAQVDRAHAKGQWLDIGISSLRNLRFLSLKRQFLWWLLAISTLPLHLIYNSTFYPAIATNNYNVLYATPAFVTDGPYDFNRFPDSPSQNITDIRQRAASFQKLENKDCIANYGHDFVTDYRNVIAVVTNVTSQYSLLEVVVNDLPPNSYLNVTYNAFAWICNDTLTTQKTGVNSTNKAGFTPCAWQIPALEELAPKWWKSGGYHIQYCLAETITADCHLHFAPQLMGPVILMNMIKVAVMFYVAYRMLDKPLVTLGDAIDSFIRNPDPTTQGMCLATARQIEYTWTKRANSAGYVPPPERFHRRRHHWAANVTRRQWLLYIFLLVFMFAGITVALYFGIKNLAPPTISNAWSLGIGNIRTQNLILGTTLPQLGSSAVLLTALVANCPQSAFSFMYMVYNTIFTSMFVGEDWDKFSAFASTAQRKLSIAKKETHRYLRVSDPRGKQRSTYFLALPYRYALPLIALSGILHWLLSQTFFLANISVVPRDGSLPRTDEITTWAYSPQGMVCLLAIAVIMILWIGGNAMRRYGGEMTLVGTNSAAISAACHVNLPGGKADREAMVTKRIAWGEVPRRDVVPDWKDDSSSVHGLGIAQTEHASDKFDEEGRYDSPFDEEATYFGRSTTMSTMNSQSDVGHCSFSDEVVLKPANDKLYA